MGFMSKRKHVKTNTYIYKHIDAQSPFMSAYQVSCTNNVMKYYDFTLHRIIRNISLQENLLDIRRKNFLLHHQCPI